MHRDYCRASKLFVTFLGGGGQVQIENELYAPGSDTRAYPPRCPAVAPPDASPLPIPYARRQPIIVPSRAVVLRYRHHKHTENLDCTTQVVLFSIFHMASSRSSVQTVRKNYLVASSLN